MKYQIRHLTTYTYQEPVSLCHNFVHLTPRAYSRQRNAKEELFVTPEPEVLQKQTDYFGNVEHFFTIQTPHKKLVITARHQTEVTAAPELNYDDSPAWEDVAATVKKDREPEKLDAFQYLLKSHYVPQSEAWKDYAAPVFTPRKPVLAGAWELTSQIYRDFKYDPRATTLATPLKEVFESRRGVCQDFAHFQIACLRSLGLPARYVSGYLLTAPPPGQPKLIGADASHAWVQVYAPKLGWVDFDPTNNLRPSDKHIVVAWGRDYDDVSPIKGIILGGDKHALGVEVDVTPLGEA